MLRGILAAAVCLFMTGAARAQDVVEDVVVEMRDGSRLVGQVVSADETSLVISTRDGLAVTIPRSSIVSLSGPDLPRLDPNYSRLMFAPTGRPLRKGDGYFADYELLFPGIAYGLTDNVTLAGGVSVVPGVGLGEQLFYVSPKIGAELSEHAAVSVGGLVAGAGNGDADGGWAAIGFAVGTFGSRKRSFTVGLGLGGTSDDGSDGVPILMVGGSTTVSRSVALVAETWLFAHDDFDLAEQPFGVSVRLFGERLSADIGVVLVGELIDEGFPIPWVSLNYQFSRRGVARSGTDDGQRRD